MSRINRLAGSALIMLFMALLLLSPFAYSQNELIDQKDIVVDTANYKTITVKTGEYKKSATTSASEYYPIQYAVRYEGASARYFDYNVRRGSEVKKGDLICTLTVDRDEVLIAQKQLALTRAKEDFALGVESREKQIEEKSLAVHASSEPFAREILRLELEKLTVALQKYRFESLNRIQDLEEDLEKLLASYSNQYIYAPIDGVISELTYFKDHQQIFDGQLITWIYDPSVVLFQVNDSSRNLRYNMEVTLTVGPNQSRVTGHGRVIACPMAYPDEGGSSAAYIRVDSYEGGNAPKKLTRPSVSYNSIYLDNVFVVDRSAVTLYGGKYFVYKLSENGMVSKRYVNHVGGNASSGSLLLQGIAPGEKLILD